ncbi:hypothetical protein [Aneurinibacillus tyrosinisolvens]|uniref:hypothetical protein n=1 Tax=Aneurinibacillus tyrosinisolvens TaxID=1443435 RepID=UPI0009E2B33F
MMGLYSMVTGIGLLASLITGFIWERFGTPASFYFNGMLAIVAALLLSFFLRNQVE